MYSWTDVTWFEVSNVALSRILAWWNAAVVHQQCAGNLTQTADLPCSPLPDPIHILLQKPHHQPVDNSWRHKAGNRMSLISPHLYPVPDLLLPLTSSAGWQWHFVTADGAGCTYALILAMQIALCTLYRLFSFHHLPHCAVLNPKALLWVNDLWSATYHVSIIALLMASPAPSHWLGSYSLQPTKVDLAYMSASQNPLRHSSRTSKSWWRT